MIDLAKGLAIGLMIGGAATIGASIIGHSKGKAADKQRSDLVIQTMVADHAIALATETDRLRALEESMRIAKQGAQRALEDEQQRNAARLAAERRGAERLREQLASYASGGGSPSLDTLSACRERATALGGVLGEALRASAACAGDAEDLAGGVRALRAAWPRDPLGAP